MRAPSSSPLTEPYAGELRCLVDGSAEPEVTREILVWRRLEPGDVHSPGARKTTESPFIEARVMTIGVSAKTHARMKRLAEAREKALSLSGTLLTSYEPAGVLIAGGGGAAFGAWLEYLPPSFVWGGLVAMGMGAGVGFFARARHHAATRAAMDRWSQAPEKAEHDALFSDLCDGWARFADRMRQEGFHTEIRVAEGSQDPLRLASIDPSSVDPKGRGFDPEDFLPTEGGGVRYETVHATGDIVTRVLEPEETSEKKPEPAAQPAKASDGEPATESDEER